MKSSCIPIFSHTFFISFSDGFTKFIHAPFLNSLISLNSFVSMSVLYIFSNSITPYLFFIMFLFYYCFMFLSMSFFAYFLHFLTLFFDFREGLILRPSLCLQLILLERVHMLFLFLFQGIYI